MTKWFDTNYHYIVPEFYEGQKFTFAFAKVVDEFQEALSLGIKTKPVLLGPFTFLKLGKIHGRDFDRYRLLPDLFGGLPGGAATLEQAPKLNGCSLTNRLLPST